MKSEHIKGTFMIFAGIVGTAVLVTIVNNKLLNSDRTFFYRFIDYIFFVNLPCFITGALMVITERGFFNVFVYSTNKVRATVSKGYRYTLLESEDVKDSDIDEHLKEKYLYRNNNFTWTIPIFVSTSTILIGIFLSVGLFYGFTPTP